MKLIMAVTVFFILFSSVSAYHIQFNTPVEATTVSCSAYSCAPFNFNMPTGYCMMKNNSTYYLRSCQSTTATYCNPNNGSCIVPPAAVQALAYPGEACALNSDCVYGNCYAYVCKGLGKGVNCTSHEQCDPGLYCSLNSTCQEQIAANGSGCRSSYDCKNYAGCNMTYSMDNGICFAYASLAIGQIVTDCANGFSQMCKTGFCKVSDWFGNLGVCATAPTSVALPQACTIYTDCQGTDGTNLYLSSCSCGYNPKGTGYCAPFIGDAPGLNLISAWKNAIVKTDNKCNTFRRGSTLCLSRVGALSDITAATWNFNNYSKILENDACIKATVTEEYWNALDSSQHLIAFAIIYSLLI
ncbi:unnamed protein product [Blepharisma stoltei]|uniref:Uncharacterized protein n=1 Tax=Blepharisma stoltei TaxID=1481888 RepID=A0AAU9J833_9CILI|nr:unnamed protein product [Blepharisma stoltei]